MFILSVRRNLLRWRKVRDLAGFRDTCISERKNFFSNFSHSIESNEEEFERVEFLFFDCFVSLFSCGTHRVDNANIGRGCDNHVLPDLSSTDDGKVLNSK